MTYQWYYQELRPFFSKEYIMRQKRGVRPMTREKIASYYFVKRCSYHPMFGLDIFLAVPGLNNLLLFKDKEYHKVHCGELRGIVRNLRESGTKHRFYTMDGEKISNELIDIMIRR